jgi:hypothetical protein
MELKEAIQIIESRTRSKEEVAKEIGCTRTRLAQIRGGDKPSKLLERAIINWAEKQTN